MALERIIVAPPAEGVIVDPVSWFESPGDVELEIGCGKGGFLLERARARPELRLVGIEWANKFFKFAGDRMSRWGVENVRLLRTDAGHFVRHHLAAGCLAALHVYHPDPWPKKRHHKRRLIQPEFVEAAVRVLRPGARWAVQTDHAEYYKQIESLLTGHPALRRAAFDDSAYGVRNERTETNFEVKYLREGRSIFRLAVVRCGASEA